MAVLATVLTGLGIDEPSVRTGLVDDASAIYGFIVADGQQRRVWRTLRDAHRRTGLWPFVSELSPYEWVEHEHLSRPVRWPADPVDHTRVLTDLVREQRHRWAPDPTEYILPSEGWDSLPRHQMYDAQALATRLGSSLAIPVPPRDLMAEQLIQPELWVCLIETTAGGYQIPARLRAPHTPNWFGPLHHRYLRPVDHSAVLHAWHERYDAQLFYLDSCSIELSVDRPPQEPNEVAEVAVEQYAYCDDFDQIIGDVDSVAREQVPAQHWYFWWD